MELRIYLLQKLTFIENQTFLQKFYNMKIWSHTVRMCRPMHEYFHEALIAGSM